MNQKMNKVVSGTQIDSQKAQSIIEFLASSSPDYLIVKAEIKDLTLPELAPKIQAELAQNILEVLAENPQQKELITKLAQNKLEPQKFDLGIGSAPLFLVAVCVLLRTHLKFHKKSDGTWEFIVEHKALDSKSLGLLLNKIVPFLPTDSNLPK